jgi:hypothetical protein
MTTNLGASTSFRVEVGARPVDIDQDGILATELARL